MAIGSRNAEERRLGIDVMRGMTYACYIGLEVQLYTPLFVVSRVLGCVADVIE